MLIMIKESLYFQNKPIIIRGGLTACRSPFSNEVAGGQSMVVKLRVAAEDKKVEDSALFDTATLLRQVSLQEA